jgi:multiple sugar transport system permease protein
VTVPTPGSSAVRPAATPTPAGDVPIHVPRGNRVHRFGRGDKLIVALMIVVPTLLVLGLVWGPAVVTVLLSFTNWDGIGGLGTIKFVGLKNYVDVITIYPPFKPAIQHNLLWLAFMFLLPTVFGIFLAVLLDKEIRGSRFYQTALYLPIVLSLALTGFIWQLIYSRDQGLLNSILGTEIDWYGDPKVNIWAVLVAASWKHTGYIMLLYLAGLKSVDPSLREAAAVDGASEVRTFFSIIFPVMRPINVIIIVVTVVESLRAFDLVWVINKGRNGLELISTLVASNVIGEASRIGFGSALAVIMLVVSTLLIAIYLPTLMRENK